MIRRCESGEGRNRRREGEVEGVVKSRTERTLGGVGGELSMVHDGAPTDIDLYRNL